MKKFKTVLSLFDGISGSKLQKKRLQKKLNYEIEPYPKGKSKRYDASGYVETQGVLF